MIAEVGNVFRIYSGIGAAAIGAFLFLYVLIRSPRNVFSNLVAGMTFCVVEWNVFESVKLATGNDRLMCLMFVGISFLPALLAHFGLSLLPPRRRVRILIGICYSLSGLLSALALAGLWSDAVLEFIDREDFPPLNYNFLFLAALGPVMVGSMALFIVRYFREPKNVRGVYGWVLLAALVGVPAGMADLALGAGFAGDRLGNFGAAVACGFILAGVLRHREYFDSVSRLRQETRSLISKAHHGLVTLDASGKVVFVTGMGTELLGGQPKTLEEIDANLPVLLEESGEHFFAKEGKILKATMVGSDTTAGDPSRHYLLLEDSTREYELLKRLSQRESLADLGTAAATLAHEIKNPLTAIGASVEALAGSDRNDPEMFDIVRGEVKRLNELVSKSLVLARVLDVNQELLDLNSLLERILGRITSEPDVRLEPGEGLREVYVDPDLLSHVVENLVKNAEQAGAHRVEVLTRPDPDHAVVLVRNDGPPIPPDVLGRLFLPFVTTKAAGTGLGLAFCAKIVKAHGGTVRAENTERGVEFTVRIPWTS